MSFLPKIKNKNIWRIADEKGNSVLSFRSVLGMSVTAGGSVVSDSIEEGSFTSYNKTSDPLEITLEIGFQGEVDELQESITKVAELKESVATFSIITPYIEYENMTLENFDYEIKTENGLGVLIVNVIFREIREVQAAYSQVDAETIRQNQEDLASADCTDASDSSVVDGGQVSGCDLSEGSASGSASSSAGTAAAEDSRSILKSGGDFVSEWLP